MMLGLFKKTVTYTFGMDLLGLLLDRLLDLKVLKELPALQELPALPAQTQLLRVLQVQLDLLELSL